MFLHHVACQNLTFPNLFFRCTSGIRLHPHDQWHANLSGSSVPSADVCSPDDAGGLSHVVLDCGVVVLADLAADPQSAGLA